METPNVQIGFVVGCARSGTTWLGKTLQQSEGFCVTIEHPVIFHMVDQIALMPRKIKWLGPHLAGLYTKQIGRCSPALYVDKSHQNIWLVEFLLKTFSKASIVAIQRDVYGTVASMLLHKGVLHHFHDWRKYPLPNYHIGLEPGLRVRYPDLPMESKCALRWLAHFHRLNYLKKQFGKQVMVISYEALIGDTANECKKLESFFCKPVRMPDVDATALAKWERVLSSTQLKNIRNTVDTTDMSWVEKGFQWLVS